MPDHLIDDLQRRVLATVAQLNGNSSQILRELETAYKIEKVLAEKGLTLQDLSTYELLKRALEERAYSPSQQRNELMVLRMQVDQEEKDIDSTLRKELLAQYAMVKNELLKTAQQYSFQEGDLDGGYHFNLQLENMEDGRVTFFPNSLCIAYRIKDTDLIRDDDKRYGEYPGFELRIKPRFLRKKKLKIEECSMRLPYQQGWKRKLSYDKVVDEFMVFYFSRGFDARVLAEFKRHHQNVLNLPSGLQKALEQFPEKLKEQKERQERNIRDNLENQQKKQENMRRFLDEIAGNGG